MAVVKDVTVKPPHMSLNSKMRAPWRYWLHPEAKPQHGPLVEPRQRMLRDALGYLPPGARVLDSGCGSGVFTAFLSHLGFDAVGIDISATVIGYARQRYPELRFEVASLDDRLPFQNNEFDAIWCTEVVEQLFDVPAALTELNRVLRPNGTLVLTTPYHGLLKNVVIAVVGFDRHFDPCGPHIRFFTRRSLRRCLGGAGFVVERWAGVGGVWPFWISHFVVARKDQSRLVRECAELHSVSEKSLAEEGL
jgi:SAM-dependent methyltransferase